MSHCELRILQTAYEQRRLQDIGTPKCELHFHKECTDETPSPDCTPHRSPDFCPLDKSFSFLIQQRTSSVLADPAAASNAGYFFQDLEDKIKGYLFSANVAKVRTPKIYHCSSDIPSGIDDFTPTTEGFVIRATSLHSSHGIYVLPNGFDGIELLRRVTMTLDDVKTSLAILEAKKIIIEEYIEGISGNGTLPIEYKIHVFNNQIGSINVVYNLGSNCACWAEVNEDWVRLDKWGCFTPTGTEMKDEGGQCHAIDFATGSGKAYPVKGLDICGALERPDECLIADITAVAKKVSKLIGAYVRIDMFVSKDNEIVVQEYTTNHMGGLRHCSARIENGCINSCFLGEMWKAAGGDTTYGGPPTGIPDAIVKANGLNDDALCEYAIASKQEPEYVPSCG